MDRILYDENKVERHSRRVRLIHWTVVISTIILFFSGFGQMPMYSRYGLTELPGMSWAGNYSITLIMHYVFGMVLAFAVTYHMVFHGLRKDFGLLPRRGDIKESMVIIKAMFGFGKEPASDKYLAEQRIAYGILGANFLLIVITGWIKVLKNAVPYNFPDWLMVLNTNLHNLTAMLLLAGIAGHLAAFVVKENRPLVKTMFTGKVDLDYVKHRHGIWYNELERGSKGKSKSDSFSA
ncbi:MAG: formate dehydrogenase subunit gamma [Thermincolia bacterium]